MADLKLKLNLLKNPDEKLMHDLIKLKRAEIVQKNQFANMDSHEIRKLVEK